MKTRPAHRRILAVAVASVAALGATMVGAAGAARAEPDPKATFAAVPAASALDRQARDLFREQRYADALAIYQRLRAETGHPTYLRNIGRCHQMMRQPAPAIDAFQTYLRDARDLGPGERTEIEGYIAEMRRLELATPPPGHDGDGDGDGGGGGAPAAPPVPTAGTRAAEGATAAAGPAGGSSITGKWWFWTGIGLLVATTGIIVAASGQDRLPCPTGAVCR